MAKWVSTIAGVVLAIVGVIWVLQGSGALGGSFMTGQKLWFLIGLIALIVGGALIIFGLRYKRNPAK
jgi:hypothetical protein